MGHTRCPCGRAKPGKSNKWSQVKSSATKTTKVVDRRGLAGSGELGGLVAVKCRQLPPKEEKKTEHGKRRTRSAPGQRQPLVTAHKKIAERVDARPACDAVAVAAAVSWW